MTWKKTAINSYSKKELLEIIADSVDEHKLTITTVEIYTMGKVGTALAECTYGMEAGYQGGMNSPKPAIIASLFGMDGQKHLYTDKAATKIAKTSRKNRESDYSVFVSEPSKDSEYVFISAVSSLRTYTRVVELTEDVEHNVSQARYFAIYELARLIYNEVNQATPVKDRKKAL